MGALHCEVTVPFGPHAQFGTYSFRVDFHDLVCSMSASCVKSGRDGFQDYCLFGCRY
jgi:hypothetical protein